MFTGNIPKKYPSLQPNRILCTQSLLEIMRAAACGFESGFLGFWGLTITSPVWGGRLLLYGAFISKPLADALRSGEKDDKKYSSTNHIYFKNEDVLSNPQNPENPYNPWFKTRWKGVNFKYKTYRREDARHRVSTRYSCRVGIATTFPIDLPYK